MSAPSLDGSSSEDGDLFGCAAAWMQEHDDVGTAHVEVQRKNHADVDRSGHENWVFKEKSYWDDRFQTEEKYDWLTGFSGIEDLLRKHLHHSDRILVVGCGNSTLSRDLYDNGYINLTNLDFSAEVIHRMAKRHSDCGATMKWVVGDMMDMKSPPSSIADGSFDVVLDKAAMDALLVDEGDVWNPREACLRDADRALSEFSRVLRPGGKLLQITFAQPHFRRKYLEHPEYGWTMLPHETVDAGLGYFFYTVVKDGTNSQPQAEIHHSADLKTEIEAMTDGGLEPEPLPEPEPAPAPAPQLELGPESTQPKQNEAASTYFGHVGRPPRCTCGCVPLIPSLFEMAELRKKARAKAAAPPPIDN